jgi:hypothetical protein
VLACCARCARHVRALGLGAGIAPAARARLDAREIDRDARPLRRDCGLVAAVPTSSGSIPWTCRAAENDVTLERLERVVVAVGFVGVEERSARSADASDELEGADVPRAGSEATEHGVARPSHETDRDHHRDGYSLRAAA